MRAIHFGAGSLGLGLVVPTLVDASFDVSVVDADQDLVAALEAASGYMHEVHDGGRFVREHIPLSRSIAATDWDTVARALREADLITTAVRLENLPRVVPLLAAALDDGAPGPYVIACENTDRASSLLGAMCGRAGDPRFLDATVDRICQTVWPVEPLVRTERYHEWTVERQPSTDLSAIAGVSIVDAIEPSFERKRYLVNTTADAIAVLGTAAGHSTLAAAASDADVLHRCRHAFEELRTLLRLRFGFSEAPLVSYHHTAIARLAAPGIERALDTVARDLARKLEPNERFVDPARGLLEARLQPIGLASLIATLIDLGGFDRQDVFTTWGTEPWVETLADLVRSAAPGSNEVRHA